MKAYVQSPNPIQNESSAPFFEKIAEMAVSFQQLFLHVVTSQVTHPTKSWQKSLFSKHVFAERRFSE